MIAAICAAAKLANKATLSIVLMSHASSCLQKNPSCYCVLGGFETLSARCKNVDILKWPPATPSTAANGTKAEVGAQHLLPLSRAKTETDFFVRVQFSISLAMGRDAPKPHSIITLFHQQKTLKTGSLSTILFLPVKYWTDKPQALNFNLNMKGKQKVRMERKMRPKLMRTKIWEEKKSH